MGSTVICHQGKSSNDELNRLYEELVMIRVEMDVIRHTLPPEEAVEANEKNIEKLMEIHDQIAMMENL